jgi:hypothetical protein
MSNLRFALLSTAVFTVAFAGMSWGSKGFSLMQSRTAPAALAITPVQAYLPGSEEETRQAMLIPAIEPAIIPAMARESVADASGAPKDSAEGGRSTLRLTAIQAANGYVRAPCDGMTKAAFIVATSTYGTAMNGAADGFTSFALLPDAEVRQAVQAALDTGGVGKDEFPSPAWSWISGIATPRDAAAAPCAVERRADNTKR